MKIGGYIHVDVEVKFVLLISGIFQFCQYLQDTGIHRFKIYKEKK